MTSDDALLQGTDGEWVIAIPASQRWRWVLGFWVAAYLLFVVLCRLDLLGGGIFGSPIASNCWRRLPQPSPRSEASATVIVPKQVSRYSIPLRVGNRCAVIRFVTPAHNVSCFLVVLVRPLVLGKPSKWVTAQLKGCSGLPG